MTPVETKKHEEARVAEELKELNKKGEMKVTRVEESKLAPGEGVREIREKDGVITVVSAVNEEELNKLKSNPVFVTEVTKEDKRTKEDIAKEAELKAGPNPTPNREGNEVLKSELGFVTRTLDRDTTAMAEELKVIAEKNSLSKEDKETLKRIEASLRLVGKA